MANQHGGYRRPDKPAPVSGPGRLSRRTDGGPGQKVRDVPGGSYGDAQDLRNLQSSAPMSLAPGALSPTPGGSPASAGIPVPVVPFNAPSQRPGEPVTTGAPLGAGAGTEILGLPDPARLQQQDAQSLAYAVSVWEYLGNLPGASLSTRAVVKQLKAMLIGT